MTSLQKSKQKRWILTVYGFAAIVLLFILLMYIGTLIYNRADQVTTVRPILGVGLAICLIFGRAVLWRVALATLIAGTAVKFAYGNPISESLLSSGLLSTSIMAIYLLSRNLNGPSVDFRNWRQLIVFMTIAAAISGVAGLMFAAPAYWIFDKPFSPTLQLWLIPSILSFSIYTPLIAIAATTDFRTFAKFKYRIAGCLLLLIAALGANFISSSIQLLFVLPLALITIALICEIEVTTLSLLVTEIAITAATSTGHGLAAFAHLPIALQLNATQLFIGALTVVLLPVAAAVSQGRKLSASLSDALKREEKISSDLRASEERYRLLADNASDIIFKSDLDHQVVYASPSTKNILGYDASELTDAIGMSIIVDGDRQLVRDVRKELLRSEEANPAITVQYRACHKDGRIVWLENRQTLVRDANGQPGGFVGIARDVSEKKRRDAKLASLSEELSHLARVGAIGQMSGAIAHELGQPLAAITNYASIAKHCLDEKIITAEDLTAARDAVTRVGAAAVRAGIIIRGLRDFIEKRPSRAKLDDLNAILQEAIAMTFLGAMGNRAQMRLQVTSMVIPVIVDRVQIQQVMHNLMRNAIEAMNNSSTCEMFISTGLEGSDFAYFEIRDTGPGIADTELANLFEPFKTTKAEGMGVGLSICKTIIEAHNGTIQVANCSPSGACFHVRIPLASAANSI